MKHVLRMAGMIALVILCTLVPFLPGSHDSFAVTLFLMAQVLGVASLLVVPVGLSWLVYQRLRSRGEGQSPDRSHVFASVALVVASVVGLFLSLAILAASSFSLGVVAFAICALLIWKGRRRISARTFSPALPVYLVVVPAAVALLQWLLADRAAEFSRNRAIANSAPMIADIERYRATSGEYPASLHAVNIDYLPGVIGIRQYHYEPNGDSYNLSFEQPSFVWGTREIVMYNPRDEQMMFGHAADRVTLPPRPLAGGGGFYAVKAASQTRWKYFLFD